jgi:cytochrome c
MRGFLVLATVLAGLATPAVAQTPQLQNGQKVWNAQCRTCHWLTDKPNQKMGPNLNGLFTRKAGTHPRFKRYSPALQKAGFMWSEKQLDQWLQKPRDFLPGNRMAFAGIRDAKARADLLAYLRVATVNPKAD